jgi:hypothetical protein
MFEKSLVRSISIKRYPVLVARHFPAHSQTQFSSPIAVNLTSISHKNRRTPLSRFQSIEQVPNPCCTVRCTRNNKSRVQGWELLSVRAGCSSVVANLRLRLGLLGAWDLSSGGEATIDWMVEESSNVVYEERIQHLGDLFLVGKFKGTLEWDPGYQ